MGISCRNDRAEHITTAALDVATAEIKHRPEWFTEAEENLLNLIEECNKAFKNYMKHPTEENHQSLKQARHILLKQKQKQCSNGILNM